MRVAVIGTGIAGNAAAWTLSKRYPVTVYDRDIRPGWHSHTVTIDYDGTQLAVDIGFIVVLDTTLATGKRRDYTGAALPAHAGALWSSEGRNQLDRSRGAWTQSGVS